MIKVAILGATGYTALESIKYLLRHPDVEIVAVTSRQKGNTPVSSVHPSLVGRLELPLEDLKPAEIAQRADVVFCCLPHCASASVVPTLLDAGAKVIDLSADYRLDDAPTYQEWYGQPHVDSAIVLAEPSMDFLSCFESRLPTPFSSPTLAATPRQPSFLLLL